MKIRVLMENSSCAANLKSEHGLSLYIETGNRKILFDAGQSGAFAENAVKLGVDLAEVDLAVLSHGHYDHGGGLQRFLTLNDKAPIYLSRYAFEPHFNASCRDIGLDPILEQSDRLVFVDEEIQLGHGISLLSCNTFRRPFPMEPFGLTSGAGEPEDFRHEQYLLIREGDKRILFSGCSHKGILNIMHWFAPDVLVGGFHFKQLSAEDPYLELAAEQLLEYPCVYYTGHCTGQAQFAVLKQSMGDRLLAMQAGSIIKL